MELTARLRQIADMVPQGFSVADIGTDHGYLPIYLVAQGISPCALACDLRPGPLDRAKAHVREYGLEEQVHCRLSDGLEGVMPGDASVVVMAGIGGRLCSDLLLQESQREKNILPSLEALLLQPQSDLAAVRHTVHRVGLRIAQEAMIVDRGKRYTILVCRPGHEAYACELEYQYGKRLMEARDPILQGELRARRRAVGELLAQLRQGERSGSAACAARCEALEQERQDIEEVLGRWT